ncbi:hypothetical protein FOYG_13110 [Fusarium oxysporum NRRL 32931]|uniref:Uncharacterized protein n=1 Tax=Fusarium oxysporum NRRL 32931 TaxID=660029 RepID=W9HQZ6_FUSOX|nr:hypothetical protein FOYG_13110 [Fusarium oxysporum NRRL 32931]
MLPSYLLQQRPRTAILPNAQLTSLKRKILPSLSPLAIFLSRFSITQSTSCTNWASRITNVSTSDMRVNHNCPSGVKTEGKVTALYQICSPVATATLSSEEGSAGFDEDP